MDTITRVMDYVHDVLAENLAPGDFKQKLRGIYWALPRPLRASNITPYALDAIACQENKRFIQIGANDGMHNDPLYHYLITSPWKGLVLEPNPQMMAKLQMNHKDTMSELSFVNAAIGEGVAPILYLTGFNAGFASFSKEHVLKHIGVEHEDKVTSVDIGLTTFSELLTHYPEFSKCDLLLIDAEGWDAKIILSIDFNVFHADLIIFEKIHITEEELGKLDSLFVKHGYATFDCKRDRLAISKSTENPELMAVLHNGRRL